jgi:hypothetical protein
LIAADRLPPANGEWVKCTWADLVTVPLEFLNKPKAVSRFFSSMVEDVNLDKAKKEAPYH